MFNRKFRSYMTSAILAIALHVAVAFLLFNYHDQLVALEPQHKLPVQLRIVDNNFEPIKPVQSKLLYEAKPKPVKPKQTKKTQKTQTKKKKKPVAKQKAKKKKTVSPSKKTTKKTVPEKQQVASIDQLDNKVEQLANKTEKKKDVLDSLPDTPETRIARRFVSRIQKQIEKSWTKPLNVQYQEMAGLKVLIGLQLDEDGVLRSAKIIQSSGNNQFDRSALNAVYKTSRFQVPSDPAIFQKYFQRVTISYTL